MPHRRYPLKPGGEPRVEISWRAGWSDIIQVDFDGETVGTLTQKEALDGKSIALGGDTQGQK